MIFYENKFDFVLRISNKVLFFVKKILFVGNLALTKNIENGKPVRVIRGYKLKSDFAPEEGYRYDGMGLCHFLSLL